MDEVLFRSSQKFESLQVQLELAATKSKDLFQQYSAQSKSLILNAWNGTNAERIKANIIELFAQIVAVAEELQYKILYFANPKRIYANFLKFVGKQWSQRDVCFALAGFLIGGIIGISIGLAIRRKESVIHYMQAVQINHFMGVESATVVEDAVAPFECGDYDVLVNVKATSVQVIDAQICNGYGRHIGRMLRRIYKQRYLPVILGRDCTGVVTDLGSKVNRLTVGDEVWLTVPFWSQGTMCQTVLVPQNRVAKKPKNIGFEGACSLPYAGSLALAALQEANVDSENAHEKRILVHGGCTPVGCVLIQLLKYWNAQITTTCYKRAAPVVRALGADDIIILSELPPDHGDQPAVDLVENADSINNALLKEFEAKGCTFDVIINTVENPLKHHELKTLGSENCLVISTLPTKIATDSCGFIGSLMVEAFIRFKHLLQNLIGFPLNEYDETHLCHVSLDKLADLVEEGHLQTVVEKVFHPQDIEFALSHVQSPQSIGSTIITFR